MDRLIDVPYAVALAIVKGRVDLAAFYNEPLDDPAVLDVARKVFCPPDPESDYPRHFPGEVRIRLRDGRELRRREPTSRGTPERRLGREAVEAKFLANAGPALGEAQARRIAAIVREIDTLPGIGALARECSRKN